MKGEWCEMNETRGPGDGDVSWGPASPDSGVDWSTQPPRKKAAAPPEPEEAESPPPPPPATSMHDRRMNLFGSGN